MISIGELDKKTTHSSHHISTPPSFHISFLNLFQAPSGPFQPTAWSFIPTTGMDRSIMSQDAVPKLPSPEILNKKLGFSKCHEFTGHIGGRSYGHDGHMASCGLRCTTEDQKVYRTCCFYFPFQIQPSHLKGTWWEIPMSKIPVTTTMTKGLQITADFCECTRQDYAHFNMFNPQTSEELLLTKCVWGRAPGANAGPVWTSAISLCERLERDQIFKAKLMDVLHHWSHTSQTLFWNKLII